MKIGVVLKKFPVVSESFILRQIEALANSREIEITIFSDFYDEELLRKLSPDLYSLKKGGIIEIIYNKDPSKFVFFNDNIDYILRALFSNPFFIVKKVLENKANFSNVIYSHFIRSFFKKSRLDIDIFHFHFLTTFVSYVLIEKYIPSNKRFVVSVRGYDCTRFSAFNQFEAKLIKESLAFDNAEFLPVSESLKITLAMKGISERVSVNYSGIDSKKIISLVRNFRENKEKIRFIQVGRLVDKKGFGDSLIALSILKNSFDFEFHIVGSGPNLSLYKEQVKNLDLDDNVIFHGMLFHKETLRLIECSDCLLVPSRTASNGDMEGIPNVIKEAMLLGTLVVASRHSGIPEIIKDESTGFLHDEGVVESQVDAIQRFFIMKNAWPTLICNAREYVKQKFDIAVTTKELICIYDKSIHEND